LEELTLCRVNRPSNVLRKLLLKLHLYIAMGAGAFIVLLGLTGSIMAFEPEIERLLHWDYYHITSGGPRLSLADLNGIVTATFPSDQITAYTVSDSPSDAWQVWLEKSGRVYLNPYSGQILGVRSDEPEFLDYVHQLHLRLLWRGRGDPGEAIISWAGVAMFLLSLSGLYLWWAVKRFTIRRGPASRRWWFDLHNVVGIFSLLFLLLLSGTGILIGFEKISVPMFYRITGSQPVRPPKPPLPVAKATPISADRALAIARATISGASPLMVEVPEPGQAYVVRMRFPEDRTPGGRSRVMVDQYSGSVLFVENSRTAPGGRRLTTINRAIHTGDIFGIPSKFLMSLASLMAALQMVSGVALWWKRSRQASSQSLNAVTAATTR
jgi:uncharacterized iron-regulated membrane protein